MKKHKISNKRLTLTQIDKIISENYQLELSKDAIQRIEKCRNYLDNKIKNQQKPIYGVTTGFGSLCDKTISENDLGKLQENLMMSHACGIGDEVDTEIVRIMLLLKIQSLAYGHSGVQLTTVQRLINIFNEQICPVVYQQGSLEPPAIWFLWHICVYLD